MAVDFGKADDRYFMAMEFVDGFHLGELKRRAGGMLEPDLACFIAMEVCLGLDYAHRLRSEWRRTSASSLTRFKRRFHRRSCTKAVSS